MYMIPTNDMKDQFSEAYSETMADKEYNSGTASDILKKMSINYKNRLERAHTGHAFYIYTMLSERGKLTRRTVSLYQSDGNYDSTVHQYMLAGKPTNPDCMCLVVAMKFRPGSVSAELKRDKENLRTEARNIVTKTLSGKTLNEVESKLLAKEIGTSIKDMIKSKKYPSNCAVGVVIADPDLNYKDGVISSSSQDMEKIQVSYKTSQFNVIVLIVAIPADTIS
eukprot:TRINITY_DN13224_c0_g1_i7.p2 TRINITY_DN13224_c0_g1~~TRINITY_DN13224_c0_g1_i7.p2  ORF type:complete len:223 (+),score=75.44 TRINITY_DN13224_c0_g1_i7:245-913(+)